jgi:hypothetical protein
MAALSAAVDVLFGDPNISAEALYRAGGGDAVPGISVRVIRRAPDRFAGFGDGRFVVDTVFLDVRIAEAPELADGDSLEIAGDFFTIRGEPRRDSERLLWHAETRAL